MPRTSSSAALPALLLTAALTAAALAGCQALGGTAGVMPETDVGPPPSMRGTVPGREGRTASVDDEGRPLQTKPTRSLDVPKTAGAASRSGDSSDRRIRRDELEGSGGPGGSNGGSMAPAFTPGGSVGLGGKF